MLRASWTRSSIKTRGEDAGKAAAREARTLNDVIGYGAESSPAELYIPTYKTHGGNHVKKTLSTYTAFAALLLAAPLAGAEPQYPPDFEPSVIYQDPSLVGKHSGTAAATAAPAAKPQAATAAPAETVSKAPAAAAKTETETATEAKAAPSAAKASAEEGGSDYLLFGGLVAALVGFVVWSSRRKACPAAASAPAAVAEAAPAAAGGATGVAKYLQAQGLAAGAAGAGAETGVAKYLKALPEPVRAVETGVAKYLKTLPLAEVAAAAETGVAKYLKSLPQPTVVATGETGVTKYLKNLNG